MIIRGLTKQQIESAVVSVENASWEYIKPRGRGFLVKLRIRDSKGPYHRRGLSRPSRQVEVRQPDGSLGRETRSYEPRRLASLCWHGFREVFDAMYETNPDTVIITAKARYDGKKDYKEKYQETAYENVGPRMYPIEYQEACDC